MKINNAFRIKAGEFLASVRECNQCNSIILVESYFRPPAFRIAEYVFYGVLRLIASKRSQTLTLGLSQLRALHWEKYLQSQHLSTKYLDVVSACENISHARAATKLYLDQQRFDLRESEPLSQIYTGRKNAYYDELLSYASAVLSTRLARSRHSQPTIQ